MSKQKGPFRETPLSVSLEIDKLKKDMEGVQKFMFGREECTGDCLWPHVHKHISMSKENRFMLKVVFVVVFATLTIAVMGLEALHRDYQAELEANKVRIQYLERNHHRCNEDRKAVDAVMSWMHANDLRRRTR